jgi:hypothetical protein
MTLAALASSATFTVSNLADSGPGSLRQAILDANANPGGDSIEFVPGLTGVIALTSGQLLISEDVALNGPGADLMAVDAGFASRVLQISAGHALISGLTFQNGRARALQFGGGIFVGGDLTLSRSAVVNCEVPLNVGMNADGGGIYVHTGRRLVLDRSLIANCRVALGSGGAVRGAASSVVEISNSTLTGCIASQGGAVSCATVAQLNFCTITGNAANSAGGGIWAQPGPFRVANSIIWGNSAPNGPEWLGPAQSLGFNIVGVPFGSSGWGAQDLTGTDPLLGPFANHGGPTWTFELQANSPARDGANPLQFLLSDQRDISRPQGGAPDIGSFEAEESNHEPIADAGPDQTVGIEGPTTNVTLDGSGSSDPDNDELTFAWFENGAQIASGVSPTVGFAPGTHQVTLVVTDPLGATGSDQVEIRVVDTAAPRIKFAFALPRRLWPPNHHLRSVFVGYRVQDNSDPKPVTWLTVSSDEPDSGLGGGDKPGDILVAGKNMVKLRAERSPSGDGRVYTITIHAKDRDGNLATRSLRVAVPRKLCRWHR